ncbi:outer membrane beta-barrel protein [Endozoicomonas ascidiicola]|uniref:outer membrane beta-barrel protein n=1 Tax=Endozoicomonas ascidiicola TaxID=1698521 RepID=UPI00082BA21C|nr:outer membrane beta-barrel protein [Endozoicomonas ascidiicola]
MLKPIASALIASSVLMASSGVMADDWFVGGTVGKVKQDSVFTGDDGSDKTKLKDTYLGVRAGKFINDNIRLYVNLGKFKDSDKDREVESESGIQQVTDTAVDIKNSELSFSMDYVDSIFSLKNTKYFVGGTLGLNYMDSTVAVTESVTQGNTTASASVKESKGDTGFIYGAQFGVIQEFTPAISAEIGYRYAKTTNEAKMFGGNLKIKQKAQKMPYMTVSYHF